MAIFGSNRQPRQVNRSGERSSGDSYYKEDPLTESPVVKPRRRLWKKLLVVLLILLVVLGISLAALYFYIKSTPLAGESSGRINLMLLGVDDAASLSDTIIIASIDTRDGARPKVALISIPRDLYVNIPGYRSAKINEAYSAGGYKLSRDTLKENFDLPIHYYATIDFTGFEELINTVGGVDVNIEEDLYDPEYPLPGYVGVEVFRLAAGQHHIDGEFALRVARCRKGSCGNDYGRAARQQQILIAFKERLLQPEVLLNADKRDRLSKTIKKHLKTDLSLRQQLKLAWLMRNLEASRLTRHVIDTSNFLSSNGSILTPVSGDFAEIRRFIDNIFSQSGNNLPEAQQ